MNNGAENDLNNSRTSKKRGRDHQDVDEDEVGVGKRTKLKKNMLKSNKENFEHENETNPILIQQAKQKEQFKMFLDKYKNKYISPSKSSDQSSPEISPAKFSSSPAKSSPAKSSQVISPAKSSPPPPTKSHTVSPPVSPPPSPPVAVRQRPTRTIGYKCCACTMTFRSKLARTCHYEDSPQCGQFINFS